MADTYTSNIDSKWLGYVSGTLPRPQLSDSKYADWVKMVRKAELDILLAVIPSDLAALDGWKVPRLFGIS